MFEKAHPVFPLASIIASKDIVVIPEEPFTRMGRAPGTLSWSFSSLSTLAWFSEMMDHLEMPKYISLTGPLSSTSALNCFFLSLPKWCKDCIFPTYAFSYAPQIWAIHGQRMPFFLSFLSFSLSLFLPFSLPSSFPSFPPLTHPLNKTAEHREIIRVNPINRHLQHIVILSSSLRCVDQWGHSLMNMDVLENEFQGHILAVRRVEEATIEGSGASVWNVISGDYSTQSIDLNGPMSCPMHAYHPSRTWLDQTQRANLPPEQDKPYSS